MSVSASFHIPNLGATVMKQVVLLILDGWGYSAVRAHNAIAQAYTPNWDNLVNTCPFSLLNASGLSVGLPDGQMGNSEVGHIHLGSGQYVIQKLELINRAFDNKDVAIEQFGSTHKYSETHVIGMLSNGGVHSHLEHYYRLVDSVKKKNRTNSYVFHLFSDGRDVAPGSFRKDILEFSDYVQENEIGKIATISGRFYPMDRDKNWDRTDLSFQAIVNGKGRRTKTLAEALALVDQEGDEFCRPIVLGEYAKPSEGSRFLLMNFRPDRIRQLYEKLMDCNVFDDSYTLSELPFSSGRHLVSVKKGGRTLGRYVSDLGFKQVRIAETEKFAHVTYFLNGGQDIISPNERHILIPSNKCKCHSEAPGMKVYEITENIVDCLSRKQDNLIIANIANADMVGHSGQWIPTIKSIEAVDVCLARIAAAVNDVGADLLITADHGNAEQMKDLLTKNAHTRHTLNDVPFLYFGKKDLKLTSSGDLTNVAATVIELLGARPAGCMSPSLII